VLCLTYGGFAFLTKLTRSAVLENLASDYARTARAKGLPSRIVLFRHVFRNSLIPLITLAAGILPGLLAGSIIVESIFSIPGMGQLAIYAVQTRDRELVLAEALVSGLLGLLSYLLSDLSYAIADPRVSYE
jgi:ABC-type dipeptide/oligopeptide/nickel transport system permease component